MWLANDLDKDFFTCIDNYKKEGMWENGKRIKLID